MSRPPRIKSSTCLLICLLLYSACNRSTKSSNRQSTTPASANHSQNVFDAYMNSDIPVADGFDFAAGDANARGSYTDLTTGVQYTGWYIATQYNEDYSLGIHTGEDWNGNGGGNTDLGQEVHAVANGRVKFAENCGRLWGNVVMLEHRYYENHETHKIISLYAHLNEIKVKS